jgi:DNA modification methylase
MPNVQRNAEEFKGPGLRPATVKVSKADARSIPLPDDSVDLVVTSPPYWRKRDYGFAEQIGIETGPEAYVDAIVKCMEDWGRVLRPTGSIFLNIGDTYDSKRSLAGVPGLLEVEARKRGWLIRNRIIWAKRGGMPSPARNRLANRHEYIIHLTSQTDYYYDLQGFAEYTGKQATPGDVWHIDLRRNMGKHLAPYPPEIVERAILLACPQQVCIACGTPCERIVKRTAVLDPTRPQAKRAMEIAMEAGLSEAHIAAIQATGVSDAGKALSVQNGTGKNAIHVKRLAAEAKAVLGGYFREFTFAQRKTVGFTDCGCGSDFEPGVVMDPFSGTGTTIRVAAAMGRSAYGFDLAPQTVPANGIEELQLGSIEDV